MTSFNCLIIDDEKGARETIKTLIQEFCPLLRLVGECSTIEESILQIQLKKPDLIFLDIKLNDGIGFEIVDFFDHPSFEIIVVSAFDDQRKKALDRFCLQYLTKPIDLELFIAAYTRFLDIKNGLSPIRIKPENQHIKRLSIPTKEGYIILKIDQIIHIESDGNYSRIITSDESILASKTLKFFDNLLDKTHFFRCHRSHLVNINFISKINFDGTILVNKNTSLPLANSAKKKLIDLIQQF